MSEARIVDLVFARDDRRRHRRVAFALALGVGAHLAAALWALTSGPSLETWSAELATRVHAELTREEVIELPKPPPPVEKPLPPPPVEKTPPAVRPIARVKRALPPPSPAQAAKIVVAEPTGPRDLPAVKFVTGTAKTYAGGVTSSTGKSKIAVDGPTSSEGEPAQKKHAPVAPVEDRSSPVTLSDTDWTCAWPREADAQEIDEQSVILQATVGADGGASSVKVLSDPGHGFGAAARACAMQTRFTPARDASGKPVRAESPPIRVHFTR